MGIHGQLVKINRLAACSGIEIHPMISFGDVVDVHLMTSRERIAIRRVTTSGEFYLHRITVQR
jgi:hypothetical protein